MAIPVASLSVRIDLYDLQGKHATRTDIEISFVRPWNIHDEEMHARAAIQGILIAITRGWPNTNSFTTLGMETCEYEVLASMCTDQSDRLRTPCRNKVQSRLALTYRSDGGSRPGLTRDTRQARDTHRVETRERWGRLIGLRLVEIIIQMTFPCPFKGHKLKSVFWADPC